MVLIRWISIVNICAGNVCCKICSNWAGCPHTTTAFAKCSTPVSTSPAAIKASPVWISCKKNLQNIVQLISCMHTHTHVCIQQSNPRASCIDFLTLFILRFVTQVMFVKFTFELLHDPADLAFECVWHQLSSVFVCLETKKSILNLFFLKHVCSEYTDYTIVASIVMYANKIQNLRSLTFFLYSGSLRRL